MKRKRTSSKTKRPELEDRFESPESVVEPLNVILYGASGSGKTTISSSFPKPLIHLDINERTSKVLRGVSGIKTLRVQSSQDLEDVYWHLHDHPEAFRTVVIDTWTQYQDLLIKEIVAAKGKKMNNPGGDWGTLHKSDWGRASGELKTKIVEFCELPIHVVFIAQPRTFSVDTEEEGSGSQVLMPEIGPRTMPSVMETLNASVDIIGNTFILETSHVYKIKRDGKFKKRKRRKVEYCMRLGPHAVYRSKVRRPKSAGEIPAYIVDPTYEALATITDGES